MAKAPAFQFYANDWLSSTRIALMTPAQEGAYIRLLAIAWNDPDCSIPDSDEELAILSRLGEGWFNGGSSRVKACFEPHPKLPGRLVNRRQLEERKKQEEWREKSRVGGLKSGESRRSAPKGGSTVVQPDANQTRTLQSSSSSSKISSIPIGIEEAQKAKSRSQSSRSRRSQACDEEWLKELQAKPAYRELNVAMLYAKMEAWCEVKGKQPTRSRLINWLNKEEVPMKVNGSGHKSAGAYVGAAPLKSPERIEEPPPARIQRSGQWGRILDDLDRLIGVDHVRTWFEPLKFAGVEDGTMRLVEPDVIFGEFIQANYASQFREAIVTAFGDECAVRFEQINHTEA